MMTQDSQRKQGGRTKKEKDGTTDLGSKKDVLLWQMDCCFSAL